jgi:ribosomal protein S27AE
LCLKAAGRPVETSGVTSIKAECPRCGAVRLTAEDVTVRVCVDDGAGAYRFRCPSCGSAVVHEASLAICALLRDAGCREESWRLPAELAERPGGLAPAFTTDDLLDFHLLLQGDDWTSSLITARPRLTGAATAEPGEAGGTMRDTGS